MSDGATHASATETPRQRAPLWAGAGGVLAAFLGSLCCAGPLLFVTFGVGASLASTFEPLRPLFGVVMLGLFAAAFYVTYRPRPAGRTIGADADADATCASSATTAACAARRARRRERVVLWLATLLAIVLWTFPTWSLWLV